MPAAAGTAPVRLPTKAQSASTRTFYGYLTIVQAPETTLVAPVPFDFVEKESKDGALPFSQTLGDIYEGKAFKLVCFQPVREYQEEFFLLKRLSPTQDPFESVRAFGEVIAILDLGKRVLY